MERLVRGRLIDRISVKRFDRATVATMLDALAGKPAPDSVVGAVFSETEGNPFFVEEVFRHLTEEGKLFVDGEFRSDIQLDELDVPESVRLVVGRRLERLGIESQRVLAAGAVVGRAFPFRLLEEISELEAGRLIDIVEEAEDARVIVPEQRDGEVHYSFAHELIRQTLLSSVSLLRRQRLHLAVAEAIERTDKRARQERPSEIANHLLQAGAAADPERTLEYLELTAQRALESAAFEEAIRATDDALAVVDPEDRLRIAKLHERQGWAVRALGRFDECIAIWDGVVSTYAENGLIDEATTLCWEMGYQLIWLSRFDAAFASYSRGLSIAGELRSASRSMLIGATGGLMGLAGLYEQAEERLEEGESIARELGDERALGRVLWGRTISNWSNIRIPQAIESGRAAIEHLRRANDQWTLVDALAWTSFPLDLSGDPRTARELAEEGVELGEKLGHRGGELLARRGVAIAWLLNNADLDELERIANDDLERFESIRSPWVSQSHAWLASLRILRGDVEEAVRDADRSIELEPPSAFTGFGWSYKFLSQAYGQDVEACRRLLADQRGALPDPGERASIGRTSMVIFAAYGCVVSALHDEAAALYPLVAERTDQIPIGLFDLVLTQRVAGMAAAAAERWDDAARHFEAALQQAEEFPNRIDEPQVRHWFGKMLLDRGRPQDHARGREMVGSAIDRYTTIGMPLHAAMARDLLRART
jgi:tetratricopeptide (TPR) repeat protein